MPLAAHGEPGDVPPRPRTTTTAPGRLDWDRDGSDWPNRPASRFVVAAGMRWHVQQMGQGPVLVLVHGTGAATHSWRDLAPLLAQRFTVIAPDLPGHGYTDPAPPGGASLPGMARAVAALLDAMQAAPACVVGHSAGAAILARACIDRLIAPRILVSLNGALLPLRGLPGRIFSPAARLLALSPFAARLFAWRAESPGAVERLIRGTGSSLDARGVALYRQLVSSPTHVAGALDMMASWELEALQRDLPRLATPLVMVTGTHDTTVPPSQAARVRQLVPAATSIALAGLGHLAHEERPGDVAGLLAKLASEHGAA